MFISAANHLAKRLGVEDPGNPVCWLKRAVFAPRAARKVVVPPSSSPLPDDAPMLRYAMLWLARELGVQDPAGWREWLVRLIIPPVAIPVERVQPASVAKVRTRHSFNLLPAMRRLLLAVLERLSLPRWVENRLRQLDAFLQAHPAIAKWKMRLAPARAVPLLDKGLAWVRQLEDEALVLAFAGTFSVLLLVASTPLSVGGQIVFAVAIVAAGAYLGRMRAAFAPVALAALSLLTCMRYVWWRVDATLDFDAGTDFVAGVMLVAAELAVLANVLARYYRAIFEEQTTRASSDDVLYLAVSVLLLAPAVFLISDIPLYTAPAWMAALYALPCVLLSLMALARLEGVSRGWMNWLKTRAAALHIPYPLALAAVNLLALIAALPRAALAANTGDVLIYAMWAMANLWVLKTGDRLRTGFGGSRMQRT